MVRLAIFTSRDKILAALLFCMLSFAQPSNANDTRSKAINGLSISLKNADIRDLIHWADEITEKTIIIHPSVKGKVTVISGDNLTREEAYDIFLSTLQIHGYTVVTTSNTLKVLPTQEVKGTSERGLKQELEKMSGDAITTKIIDINHAKAEAIASIAKGFVDKDSNIAVNKHTNQLILSGRQESIDAFLPLIRNLDNAPSNTLRIYKVKHSEPKSLFDSIKLITKKGSNKSRFERDLELSLDSHSRSLLFNGDPERVNKAYSIAQSLDVKKPSDTVTMVKHLNFIEAKEILPTVKALITAAQERYQTGEKKISSYVEAIENQNALVISAPSAAIAEAFNVLAQLDVRKKQVFVEALIVEVNEDINRDLGIEWQAAGERLIGGVSAFGSLNPLTLADDGGAKLGSGLSVGYVSGSKLKAILNALAVETNANILSTPTLMALDNEEAEILVGENVPFITGTEARAGSDPFQTISRQDIGVTLKVKPKINYDSSVTLEIEQKVESIGQTTADTADIITNKREIKTRVLIDNGDVLVLGGLIRDEVIDKESRVPILGDIPVLGKAFRNSSTSTIKRNLMVFIHPVVVDNQRSGNAISEHLYNDIKQEQTLYNRKSRGYPVGPEPIKGPELPTLMSKPARSDRKRHQNHIDEHRPQRINNRGRLLNQDKTEVW